MSTNEPSLGEIVAGTVERAIIGFARAIDVDITSAFGIISSSRGMEIALMQ